MDSDLPVLRTPYMDSDLLVLRTPYMDRNLIAPQCAKTPDVL